MTSGSRGGAGARPARALILASVDKPAVREFAAGFEPWLAARVDHVRTITNVREYCAGRERWNAEQRQQDRPDLLVVLGGDGALLGAVRAFSEDPVPTLGIHLGRVGFLASTPSSRWEETVEAVLAGDGVLEPRMRLQAAVRTGASAERVTSEERVALNEVVLQRGAHQGMLELALFVGDTWVTNYRADGVIVATPSGSTAYSLSAGGPILEPSVEGIVVTPICSQGLSNRPIVLSASDEPRLEVVATGGITTLAVDGQSFHSLHEGDALRLRRHPVPYPLYAMRGLDPYRRLRERLGWRGSVEPLSPPNGIDGPDGAGP